MSVPARRLRAIAAGLFRRIRPQVKKSYAQCGEDIIMQYVFDALGINAIRYLDIGAHHPSYLSNTCFFYLKGHRGVCVEPNRRLLSAFREHRPGDSHRFPLQRAVGPGRLGW